jgi:hypothetical protein
MTACTATGVGKGRSARQNCGFTKWPHSHWAEPNNSKSCTVTQSGIKIEMAGNNDEQ